ncbi:MAG: hypothetical protein LBT39_02450 [Treponema sp.]|jgi:hypothetical protein|nr:hypothetical protein [Treponema sp.]
MTKKNSAGVLVVLLLCAGFTLLVSCGALDQVANTSVKSFEAMLAVLPEKAQQTNGQQQTGTGAGFTQWTLSAPDRTAAFTWNDDVNSPQGITVQLVFSSVPFINAGLNAGRLNLPGAVIKDGVLSITANFAPDGKTGAVSAPGTALGAYEVITKAARKRIGYHAALDHFGVDLGGGNMFEWAKDLSTNDKDIVFVLNPEPFIAAGVDPARVEGWAFAKVTVMDERNRKVEVDKLLKPFDLR